MCNKKARKKHKHVEKARGRWEGCPGGGGVAQERRSKGYVSPLMALAFVCALFGSCSTFAEVSGRLPWSLHYRHLAHTPSTQNHDHKLSEEYATTLGGRTIVHIIRNIPSSSLDPFSLLQHLHKFLPQCFCCQRIGPRDHFSVDGNGTGLLSSTGHHDGSLGC